MHNVSKKHFVITKDDNGIVYITDLSKNGTFINGKLIGKNNRNILKSDDEISVGFRDLKGNFYEIQCFFFLTKFGLSFSFFKVYVYKTMQVEDDNFLPPSLRTDYIVSRRLGNGACGEVRLIFETVRTFFNCGEFQLIFGILEYV